MKVYVAAKFEAKEAARTAMAALVSAGHEITHDWTAHEEPALPGDGSLTDAQRDFFRDCAADDFTGVFEADVLVLLNHEHGKGMFTEMGIALAYGMPVFVVDIAKARNIFFHAALVRPCENVAEVIVRMADAQTAEMIADRASMKVALEVFAERRRQDEKWGEQNHDDGTGVDDAAKARGHMGIGARYGDAHFLTADDVKARCQAGEKAGTQTFAHILLEEVAEALEETEPAPLRKELVQVAAVATAWAEAIDRREVKRLLAAIEVAKQQADSGQTTSLDDLRDHLSARRSGK
jgi:hypothetical protein